MCINLRVKPDPNWLRNPLGVFVPIDPDFGVTLSNETFEERFLALHKQLFASQEFAFNEVATHIYAPPEGTYKVDNSFC
jgi:hypothetical protein